ncbi:Phage integrase family [Raoultella planticola]|uniref:Phage integrase family n=1 Tax=Raoultella planticola TaxID=575 RepID=A0A485B372_RAOPL|nr:Phage integrase family [Raoultella planticola]
MQNVTLIGMYSGMRLNEICSLRAANIREIEGVLCFEVTEGKTRSASRVIPCHSLITPLVLSLREKPYNGFLFYRASMIDRADGKRSTWHTSVLHVLNARHWESRGTERKVFHSLRHGVAQILDRGGGGTGKLKPVQEDRIALLLGHERGSTESFKTYSKNSASPVELRQYIELIRYPEIEKGA